MSNLTAAHEAQFLAATAVSHASSYLQGQCGAADLMHHADRLKVQLGFIWSSPLVDAAQMLATAMYGTARCDDDARRGSWRNAMTALMDLVRDESLKAAAGGATP